MNPLLRKAALFVPVFGLVSLLASVSHADVTSWLGLGTGATWLKQGDANSLQMPLDLDLGVGASPASSFVLGGVAKGTVFSHGMDLGLALRGATQSFAQGSYGLAVDVGPYQRWWGEGSTGLASAVHLGGPYGLQLSLRGAIGSNEQQTYGLSIGVDLLRLTVHRPKNDPWWPNPRVPGGQASGRAK